MEEEEKFELVITKGTGVRTDHKKTRKLQINVTLLCFWSQGLCVSVAEGLLCLGVCARVGCLCWVRVVLRSFEMPVAPVDVYSP